MSKAKLYPKNKKKAKDVMLKLSEEGEELAKEVLDKITRKVTLKTLHTITDPCNFELMNMLPATSEEVSERFDWSVSQLNRRISKLEELQLIARDGNPSDLCTTDLGDSTLAIIKQIEVDVKKVLPDVV
jgi:DNA-binding MarR family transcriptional regulator